MGYNATFEKYTSCKASLGTVIKDKNWVTKFRSITKIITDMRWHGSRAFCDYILSTIVTKRVSLLNKRQLKNTIRACYIMHTVSDVTSAGRHSTFFDDVMNREWHSAYLEECNIRLLDKKGLTNIISHDVNDFTVSVINYLHFGIRDHFLNLIKYKFKNYDREICEIAALRFLKLQTGIKKEDFCFELSEKDIFRAGTNRIDEKEKKYKRY